VECDAIKVRHDLINVRWSSSVLPLATCWAGVAGSFAPANTILEKGLDEHVLVVEEEHGGGIASAWWVSGMAGSCGLLGRCGAEARE
jgi:hypothetical protein